jgi:hypothetical protein
MRSHLRSATACLVRCAARRTREERGKVGRRTFDWKGPQRGRTVGEEARGESYRDQARLAEPQAAEGEGFEPPPQQASAGDISSAERRPKATAAAAESTGQENHAVITSPKGLPKRQAQRFQAKPAAGLRPGL